MVTAALHELEVTAELSDTAALLTSELVTNAVLHGRSGLAVIALADADVVRVEVADGTPVMPRLRPARPDGTTGRGMQLIASLASRWGMRRLEAADYRKVVWFELDQADQVPGTVAGVGELDWESVQPL